jgi:hypothetical protein
MTDKVLFEAKSRKAYSLKVQSRMRQPTTSWPLLCSAIDENNPDLNLIRLNAALLYVLASSGAAVQRTDAEVII